MAEPTPNSGYIVKCVEEMESLDLDEYGFNLMRTFYEDEALWQTFRQNFDAVLDKGMRGDRADAMKRLADKVVTRIHDDFDLTSQGPEGVSAAFQIFCLDEDDDEGDVEAEDEDEENSRDKEDNQDNEDSQDEEDGPWTHEMGPGIIRSICLMADEACMRSDAPYVIAVDALLHTGADLGYSGHFKVAIDCLMPKFYAAVGRFDLAQVAAAVDEDDIWRGMQQHHKD